VAIARGVERAAGLSTGTVKIKWPNDLMIDGKKLAGILVETFPWRQRTAAVLGVGVNVSLEAEQLRDADPELSRRVTSLAMIGRRVDRLAVLRAVMMELDAALAATDLTPMLDQWRQRCEQMSRMVTLSCSGRVYRGTVENLDPHEGLIVRTQEGALVHLPAATTTVLG
jgi:BirA family biotin operon repressor/biotin-[acetyl-CoA-carboxylase] ligase